MMFGSVEEWLLLENVLEIIHIWVVDVGGCGSSKDPDQAVEEINTRHTHHTSGSGTVRKTGPLNN